MSERELFVSSILDLDLDRGLSTVMVFLSQANQVEFNETG